MPSFQRTEIVKSLSIYNRFFNEKAHHQILGYRLNGFGFILSWAIMLFLLACTIAF